MIERHGDDLMMLEALAGRDPQAADDVVARTDERNVDAVRVARWLASARTRGLVEIEADADHVGRQVGSRRYGLNDAGARYYRQLVDEQKSSSG